MNAEVGQILNGKHQYRILEVIDCDVNSTVCLARVQKSGQLVVVKILAGSQSHDFIAQYRRDAALLNEIDSSYIARIMDYGSHNGDVFIAMENVEGLLLSQVLAEMNGGQLDQDLALWYLWQLAEALVETGKRNLVHGQIRPQNIVVTPEGGIKLIGFGIAANLGASGVRDMDRVSALAYAAPELLEMGNPDIDIRADIYSVGAVGYEMFTGHPPFEGQHLNDLIYMIVMETRPAPSHYNSSLNPEVESFVIRCMAKDPAERFQTAQSMLAALQGLAVAPATATSGAVQTGTLVSSTRPVLLSKSGATYLVPEGGGILGRSDPDTNIPVAINLGGEEHGRTVSRQQAQLRRLQGQWIISPYPNTTNATLLNGRVLKAATGYPLKDGDELQLGGVKLLLRLEETFTTAGSER